MRIGNVNNNFMDNMLKLSTMKKVNAAKDNVAGLSIIEKLKSEAKGYDTGYDNSATAKDMFNVAEGGLSSITDDLQRIRELSVQSQNMTYSDDDKAAMQMEIDGLKASIEDAANGTEFNTKKLLNGSMSDINIASNPSGGGMKIEMTSSTLESLGIADYDITKDFKISDIDNALSNVMSSRAKIGATTNSLDHVLNYNSYASLNLNSSKSAIEELDIGKAVSEKNKDKILMQYKMFAESAKLKQDNLNPNVLLAR